MSLNSNTSMADLVAPAQAIATLSPQCALVLGYLKGGRKLTNMIAINSLGVGSITSRIAELRKAGFEILDEWAEDYGGAKYKRYFLPNSSKTGEWDGI